MPVGPAHGGAREVLESAGLEFGEVAKEGTGCADGRVVGGAESEAIERGEVEAAGQFLAGQRRVELPALPGGAHDAVVEVELGVGRTRHFGRRQTAQYLGQRRRGQGLQQEFAGGEVDGRHAGFPASPRPRRNAHRHQVVVPAAREPSVLQQRAGGDGLDHFAPDDPLGQLRIFDLLADGHAEPGAHQLPQVVGGRLDRHAGERDAVPAAGERDAQQLGGALGVIEEHLVEIAHAEEQDGVLVPRLDLAVLQHERGVERIGHGRVLGHQHERTAAELGLDGGRRGLGGIP